MATITITKSATGGNIGKEDLTLQSSTTTTFSRGTSTGGTNTLTRLARSTLNTREYDVVQFGAVGNGLTDDTAAIQAAITACTVTGGTVVFPPGYTFAVAPPVADSAIFTLGPLQPMTFWMYGSAMRVVTADNPTTAAIEKASATIFKAIDVDNLTFLGGTIDLNRDYAGGDPMHGFFKGMSCNHITFKDITFKDCSNYHGAIFLTDVNGASLGRWHSLTVENCTFLTSSLGVSLEGAMRNVQITGNKFQHMDVAIYRDTTNLYGIDDGYGASTYKPARCVKIKAFGNGAQGATDTVNGGVLGTVSAINVSGNTMYGCSLGIEATAGSITDSQYFENVTIEGNSIFGLSGITLTMASNSVIKGNTFKRLNSTDMSVYDDTAYVNGVTAGSFLTDVTVGSGIDARTCQDVLVSGNVIDCGYAFSAQENECDGILIGENTLARNANGIIDGNILRKCRYGIVPSQCSLTMIRGNKINRTKYPLVTNFDRDPADSVRNTAISWRENVLEGNTFIADASEHSLAGNSLSLVELESEWIVRNNLFLGRTATGTDLRLLILRGFDANSDGVATLGDYTVKDNVFRKFEFTPVEVVGGTAALAPWAVQRVSFTGNEFYSEQTSLPAVTVGCIQLGRATNTATLVVNGGHNYANKVRRAFIMTYPELDGGTGTYNFGQWDHDQNSDSTSTWRLFDDGGVANTNATGYADVFRGGRGIQTRHMQINCNGTGATTVIANALPYGIIWHVSCRNDSLLVMGSSGAGYVIGYGRGTTALFDSYWGSVDALTADTVSNTTIDSFPTTPLLVGSASTQNDIILTAKLASGARGGTFTSGQVVVTVYYSPFSGDDF